jgi:hypothetical protein
LLWVIRQSKPLCAGLPENILKLLREAKRYAEGTAVRIEVKALKDVAVVKKLATAKLEN